MQWGIFLFFSVFELPPSFQYLPYRKALQALRKYIQQAQERIAVDTVGKGGIFTAEYFQRFCRYLLGRNTFCLHAVDYIPKSRGITAIKLRFVAEFFSSSSVETPSIPVFTAPARITETEIPSS